MRIAFIGTGEIGVPALRWLLADSGQQVVGLVCQPDRPSGRRQVPVPPLTRTLAVENGVPVFQPEKIIEAAADFRALRPDLTVVVAYGQFLPRPVREGARLACVNLHASLLPRWRGASPIQAAIAAGDVETGITVMHVAAEMDSGDVILAERLTIRPDDTFDSLQNRLALLAPQALARAIVRFEAGTAPRMAQDTALVTHCGKLTRQDGVINWTLPALEIERRVRAFHSWPGTTTRLPDGTRLKVFPPTTPAAFEGPRAGAGVSGGAPPGTILEAANESIVVSTGDGALRIFELQPEGRRRMNVREFLSGHPLEPGRRLGHD